MATIVSDIDGTVFDYGKPVKAVVDFVKKYDNVIFMTNRPSSERAKTVSDLKKVGIKYSELIMNTTGESAPKFKKGAVEMLIEDEGLKIDAFIDDRLDTRNAIRSLDKKIRVYDPAKIGGSKGATMASYSKEERLVLAINGAIITLSQVLDNLNKNDR